MVKKKEIMEKFKRMLVKKMAEFMGTFKREPELAK